MNIPQDVLESGVCTISPDTDPELVFSVESYNNKMAIARRFRRKVWLLERVFLALNIGMPIIFGMMPTGVIYVINPRITWLEWAALGTFVGVYLIFGLFARNLVVVTIASALLILTDARCALLVGINIVLAVFYQKGKKTLKSAEGYPKFRTIRIEKKDDKADTENIFTNPLDKSPKK
ncbi:MAG: hypothetical protein K2J77_03035 [Oscillospiraceae bacterium]|nr:hypothetical protein [Oscillospiraceae bacterium]